MDTNECNERIAHIVASNVDLGPIKEAKEIRKQALACVMNPEAAEQFISEMEKIEFSIFADGPRIIVEEKIPNSYLLEYLKSHDVPMSGGEDGLVHNVDGEVYISNVPIQLQGTPLPWYELPIVDCEEEMMHIDKIMTPDAIHDSSRRKSFEINEATKPLVLEKTRSIFGGDLP